MNCPFYGRMLFQPSRPYVNPPFLLMPRPGKQCAIVVARDEPCIMEANGQVPDWETCLLLKDMRVDWK